MAMSKRHLDTIDLYQARARSLFAQSAAKLCGASEQQVSADLLWLIEKLEAARLAMRKNGDEQNHHEAPMTPAERDVALAAGRSATKADFVLTLLGQSIQLLPRTKNKARPTRK